MSTGPQNVGDPDPNRKLSHGEYQERKLLLFYAIAVILLGVFGLTQVDRGTRIQIILWGCVVMIALLAIAKYIVYSAGREKKQKAEKDEVQQK